MDREDLSHDSSSESARLGRPTAAAAQMRTQAMLHFSCDLCGKELLPDTDRRYVVKMEVFAAHDPRELTEDDLGDDNLEALGEVLEQLEDGGDIDVPPAYKQIRYDLCPDCHKKFLR